MNNMQHARAVFAAEPERDRAAEARIGGRLITSYLAGALTTTPWQGTETIANRRAWISGEAGPAKLAIAWRAFLSPAAASNLTPAQMTQLVARSYADNGGPDASYRSQTLLRLAEAEAMVEWPIYRAAYIPPGSEIVSSDLLDKLGVEG